MNKHTPGPWIFSESLSIFQAEGECELVASVACRSFIDPSNTEVANGRLIAAAPDLLSALVGLLEYTDHNCFDKEPRPNTYSGDRRIAAIAAIEKATGGQA